MSPFATAPPESLADMERVRREYRNHEAAVQSIGTLYYLGAIGLLLASISLLVTLAAQPGAPHGSNSLLFAVLCASLAAVNMVLGRGLRRLRPWVRTPVGILSGLGLLAAPPVGTLINGYILYLLFSRKGAMVFSPAYQEIIRQTPHIRYRTSALAMGCLIVLAIGVVLALLIMLLPF